MATELYQYSPISRDVDEIRLLDLSPHNGLSENVLSGTLRPIKVSDLGQAQYETVSYRWGNADTCQRILIDGKVLLITQNAYLALQRVAYVDRPRALWLDSVCVNQADIEERMHQILLMGEVYSRCRANLVHLVEGEANREMVDRAVDNVLAIDEEIYGLTDGNERFKSLVQPNMQWEFAQSPAKIQLDVDALLHLFSTAWFRQVESLLETPWTHQLISQARLGDTRGSTSTCQRMLFRTSTYSSTQGTPQRSLPVSLPRYTHSAHPLRNRRSGECNRDLGVSHIRLPQPYIPPIPFLRVRSHRPSRQSLRHARSPRLRHNISASVAKTGLHKIHRPRLPRCH